MSLILSWIKYNDRISAQLSGRGEELVNESIVPYSGKWKSLIENNHMFVDENPQSRSRCIYVPGSGVFAR